MSSYASARAAPKTVSPTTQAMFALVGEKIDARPHLAIKRTRTHCLLACRAGAPVLVVYPEGVWYRCPDEAALDRIVSEHLEGGREVRALIFHRLGEGDMTHLEPGHG